MRIVNLDKFIKLPAGTVFSKYTPYVFGSLHIKRDVNERNFSSSYLLEVDASDDGERSNLLEAAELGSSFKLDLEYCGRDGLFKEDQLFIVYEKEDVEQLMTTMYKCLKTAYKE